MTGTKIFFIELGKANSLLLMEAIKPGAYQRALDKRGPGFHHFAIDVFNLDLFLESITSSDWSTHPISLKTIPQTRTAWLSCPGFPLIEIQEQKTIEKMVKNKELFINKIFTPMKSSHPKSLVSIGLHSTITARTPLPKTL
jgi:hypothetical protein